MKVKTSVTLSEEVLRAIDEVAGPGCNRSAILEQAALDWLRHQRRDDDDFEAEVARLNRLADSPEFQREHAEAMSIAVPWWEVGDEVELLPEVEERIAREAAAREQG